MSKRWYPDRDCHLLQIIKHLFSKGIWHSMKYITISKPLWTYNHTGPLNRYNCWTCHIASSIHCHTSHTTRTLVSSLTCSLQFSPHWRTVMNILKSAMVPYIAALLHRNNKMHFTHSHPHCTLIPFVIHAYSHLYIMVYKKEYDEKMHTTSNMECFHCYARFIFSLHTAFLKEVRMVPSIHTPITVYPSLFCIHKKRPCCYVHG
jgi:hypothetical protein